MKKEKKVKGKNRISKKPVKKDKDIDISYDLKSDDNINEDDTFLGKEQLKNNKNINKRVKKNKNIDNKKNKKSKTPKEKTVKEKTVKEKTVKNKAVKNKTVKEKSIKDYDIKNKTKNKSNENYSENKKRKYQKKQEKRKNQPDYYDDSIIEKYDNIIRRKIIILIIVTIIFVFLLASYIILNTFQVKNVIVEGNKHYTDEQIAAMVEKGKFGDNSIYLSLKYSNRSITDIPFIQSMDVDVINRNTIKISVYEKKLAGYVEYLGKYMYFDKDGIVVETSNVKTEGVPLVTGLTYDHFVMYEPLPVENDKIFKRILNVTQLLNKYEISTDRIYFDSDYEMTLYFGTVRVAMGEEEFLEEKIQRLQSILPQLEGKKGLLDMKSLDEGLENITFTLDGGRKKKRFDQGGQ